MNKFKAVGIIVLFSIIILLIQNKAIARYYEVLDIINVRFTIEEKINTGENNYEVAEL